MGFGDYLSSKAELAFQLKEKSRETWEYDNYLEGEKKEMVELYVKKGMTEEDATLVRPCPGLLCSVSSSLLTLA